MNKLKSQLSFDYIFSVPSRGRSGGLSVMWKKEAQLSLRTYSQNHVDFEVENIGDNLHWRITFFYGFPAEADRHKSWQLLESLNANSSLPWCCIGDFNEVLRADEQEGGDLRSERQMMGFWEVLARCQFNDLGYLGNKFTWATTRGGDIKVRLDRVLANQEWIDLFLSFRVEHLKPTTSDHIPILFEWVVRKRGKYKKAFRSEEGWTAKRGVEKWYSWVGIRKLWGFLCFK